MTNPITISTIDLDPCLHGATYYIARIGVTKCLQCGETLPEFRSAADQQESKKLAEEIVPAKDRMW